VNITTKRCRTGVHIIRHGRDIVGFARRVNRRWEIRRTAFDRWEFGGFTLAQAAVSIGWLR
jgi:hypothetical protein